MAPPSDSTVMLRAGATAMHRVELSRPVRLALEQGIVRPGDDVFDYGCGYGTDVDFLRELGHEAHGWDPAHSPDAERRQAAVVNLGYVLNVIDQPRDRRDALEGAWRLARRALVVAVRTTNELSSISCRSEHSDGMLTGAETFQKLFTQAEARQYVSDALGQDAIPLSVGVFAVFRHAEAEQEWLESRRNRRQIRRLRRLVERRQSVRDRAYEENREALLPLEEFLASHGRLPQPGEFDWVAKVENRLGSVPRAFQVIRHVATEPWWDAAAEERRAELTVRFALARLRKRPKFTELPGVVRNDVKALFGSYRRACEEADDLLFSIGSPEVIREAARTAAVGKRTPDAFYAHLEAVDLWPAELRVLVGAAEALLGAVPDATLVKVHLDKPRVSWLVYPDFDTDPHPALTAAWVVDLRELDVRPADYSTRENPPVLHRKELFVTADHHRRDTFSRLTAQEERHGLLSDASTIGTRDGWNQRLSESGWRLRGHRLVRQ